MSFPREFNFNKLLFGGFLDEEVINKLDKIQGFRMDKDIIDEDDQVRMDDGDERSQPSAEPKVRRKVSDGESSDRSGQDQDSFEVLSGDEEEKGPRNGRGEARRQVQFEGASQGIDLSVLYRNEREGELVYRLTELYVPKQQKQRMIDFNRDLMRTQNDIEMNGAMRVAKRHLKEELKAASKKIRHSIRYCQVPANLIEEAKYRYRPGMTTKDLQVARQRNKYESAPHIGRILPSKKPVVMSQEQTQRIALLQEQHRQRKEEDLRLKNYVDDANTTGDISLADLTIEPAQIPESPSLFEEGSILHFEEEKVSLEARYIQIMAKMREKELSLADLSIEERASVKEYLKTQTRLMVEARYPTSLEHFSADDKQSLAFMKHLERDFSFKGKRSLAKSNDVSGMLLDEPENPIEFLMGSERPILFEDLRFSDAPPAPNQEKPQEAPQDAVYHQWYIEQKFKQMAAAGFQAKRRKYWGEPQDCSSAMQIARDNQIYMRFLNHGYQQRGKKEETLFTVDQAAVAVAPVAAPAKLYPPFAKPADPVEEKAVKPKQHPIKDLQEYEFLQQQKAAFYQAEQVIPAQQTRQLNAIIRNARFALGDLSAEEFYQQEALDDPPTLAQSKSRREVDMNDNLDFHFERKKKELHDRMLSKMQQQEKQNQSGAASNQTLAYSSGKDVLMKVGDGSVRAEAKRQGSFEEEGKEEGDQEEGLTQHMHEGAAAEEKKGSRVTVSRANELNHARCILKLTYTRFEWSDKDLQRFHRPDLQEAFEQMRRNHNPMQISADGRFTMQLASPLLPKVPLRVPTQEYIERHSKKIGITAHDYFKDRFKLSLKTGRFSVFEHVDQRPLFVNNFGMASKLKRYVYSDEVLPTTAFTKKPENALLKHMGPHGAQVLKKKGEKIPLLGQIDPKQYRGITVLENNMYYCPAFYHRAPRNDFLCLLHQDKHGSPQIYLRELQEVYLVGQLEPKVNMDVYNPQSRTYQHFIKRRTQAYVIRFLQENERISFFELNKFFSYINDQILKKIIKEIHVEVDRNQTCALAQEYKDEQFRQLVTPENVCQYESAQYGEQMLKRAGIREITNADKISYASNKFCSEEADLRKQLIARIIEEEVLSTPWNLSQNFNHNRQQRGMMMLEGIGDPSNGHGGYSYLKLPLKISQDSLNKAKMNRMYLNPAIQNPKAVTGTDADLRKLSKSEIQRKLVELGYKKEQIEAFTRWQMVALLRDRSSQAVTQGLDGEMKKFARGVRFTSKKQREMYQKQVNDIFKKQISYLQAENPTFIADVSDSESRDQRQKKLTEMQQINHNYSKSMVELKEDIPVTKITDIPNYEILLMNSAVQGVAPLGVTQGAAAFQGFEDREAAKKALKERLNEGFTLECTILRKKIKQVNGDKDKIERVVFCSDLRQIKGFNKRKHKNDSKVKRTKKTSLKEKMQSSKTMQESSDYRGDGRRSELSSIRPPASRRKPSTSSNQGQNEGASIKIQIGGATAKPSRSGFAEPTSRPQSIMVPDSQSNKFKINLSALPPAPLGTYGGGDSIRDFSTHQEFGRIQIPSYDDRSRVDHKKKAAAKKSTRQSGDFGDEDYESNLYRPKQQAASRRRQQSIETVFNQLFEDVVDSCIKFDQTKIFATAVKKKDAPNYYDVIREPIDLGQMKNKAKRLEYLTVGQFMADLNLLRSNAETFNGMSSGIAVQARMVVAHAEEKLEAVKNDIANYEMLVAEKIQNLIPPK